MYKINTLLLAGSLLFLMTSCVDDPEKHALIPEVNYLVLFADQTSSSISFETYDSWTVTPDVEWITVYGDSHLDIPYNYMNLYHSTVSLIVQPNLTGKTRQGSVRIKSYDYSSPIPIVQLGLLDVWHPSYKIDSYLVNSFFDEYSRIPDNAHYELIDSAHWEVDSICFTVQNPWKLEVVGEPEWLVLGDGVVTGPTGENSVKFTLVPNLDKKNGRETKLRLTSGDVSNEIIVRQLPDKKEKEEKEEDNE